MQLLPPEITVLDADNGENGVGASYRFTFANDDAMWTPGEESLPRTVRFVVAARDGHRLRGADRRGPGPGRRHDRRTGLARR